MATAPPSARSSTNPWAHTKVSEKEIREFNAKAKRTGTLATRLLGRCSFEHHMGSRSLEIRDYAFREGIIIADLNSEPLYVSTLMPLRFLSHPTQYKMVMKLAAIRIADEENPARIIQETQAVAAQAITVAPRSDNRLKFTHLEKLALCEQMVKSGGLFADFLHSPEMAKPYTEPFRIADELKIPGCGNVQLEQAKEYLGALKKLSFEIPGHTHTQTSLVTQRRKSAVPRPGY